MHCCSMVCSQVVLIASGSPFNPSHTAIITSTMPRFFTSEKDLQPEPGTLSTVTSPDPCGCRVPRSS